MTVTIGFLTGILDEVILTGKILDPAAVFVGLFISGPTTTPPVTVADFTLPNATDCPTQAVTTWLGPERLADGSLAIQSPAKRFQLPTSTNAFMCSGWYLADALTAGNVLAYYPIAPGIGMMTALDAITIVARVCVDPAGRWDASVVIDG